MSARTRGATKTWRALACCALLAPVAFTSAARAAENAALPTSEQVAERLAGALRFRTISHANPADVDGAPFRALHAYLKRQYPRTHRALRRETVNEYSLLYEWRGADPTRDAALFMSHLDVVPAESPPDAPWQHPPFAGLIRDGAVWGRGALDVKSGVILWLEAVEALLAQGFTPVRTVYLAFGHDEEVGGTRGAGAMAALLEERGVRLALLFDEGGFIVENFPLIPGRAVAQIATAEKAYFTLQLVARGEGGHSSMPPRHTAVGRIASAIHRLEANPMPLRLSTPVRELLELVAPYQPSALQRFALRNLWLSERFVVQQMADAGGVQAAQVRTTQAATMVRGGVKENVLPERAEAMVNFRILPGQTREDVLRHVRATIADPDIELVPQPFTPPPRAASVRAPGFALARRAIESVLPEVVVVPGMLSGATDSLHYARLVDDVYRFIPVRADIAQLKSIHGKNEHIQIAPLADSVRIAVELVRGAGE